MFKKPSCVEKEFRFKKKLESRCNGLVQDVYLNEEFDKLQEKVREVKPDIQIVGNLINIPNDLVQDVYLDEEFDKLLEEVREVKPDIQVVGYLKSDVKDPLSVVKTFISSNQDHWLQLCQQFDSQGVLKITRADFVQCLKVG